MLNASNPQTNDNKSDEFIRINRDKKKITAGLNFISFQDKDTEQFVVLMSTFDISGYGKTKEDAIEMIKASIEIFFSNLLSLSTKKMEKELKEMGFENQKNSTKEFSKAYVDVNGNLQDFNAVNDKIEHFKFETA